MIYRQTYEITSVVGSSYEWGDTGIPIPAGCTQFIDAKHVMTGSYAITPYIGVSPTNTIRGTFEVYTMNTSLYPGYLTVWYVK